MVTTAAASSKVTWGPNTVFPVAGNASAPATTATPTTSLFGTPAAPSTSLFGTPTAATATAATTATPSTAAPSTSLFGAPVNVNVNSPSTSLFGTPSTFGTPAAAPSTFGTPGIATPTTPNNSMNHAFSSVLGAPQQAALQAHMNVTMHQEASRLTTQLMQLYAAYNPNTTTIPNPTATTAASENVCRFQHIFYDPITQAQKLEKLSLPTYPPKPSPHISDETWNAALTQNPDPEEYIPVLVTSAEGLHTRLVSQQSKMKLHEQYLTQLESTLSNRRSYNDAVSLKLCDICKNNIQMRHRLLNIMQKLEIARGKHVPLQMSEQDIVHKLHTCLSSVDLLQRQYEEVYRDAEHYERQWNLIQREKQRLRGMAAVTGVEVDIDDNQASSAMEILNKSKSGIDELMKIVKKNERDMDIVKKGTGLL